MNSYPPADQSNRYIPTLGGRRRKFNMAGTTTGRMSSRYPQMSNIPRGILTSMFLKYLVGKSLIKPENLMPDGIFVSMLGATWGDVEKLFPGICGEWDQLTELGMINIVRPHKEIPVIMAMDHNMCGNSVWFIQTDVAALYKYPPRWQRTSDGWSYVPPSNRDKYTELMDAYGMEEWYTVPETERQQREIRLAEMWAPLTSPQEVSMAATFQQFADLPRDRWKKVTRIQHDQAALKTAGNTDKFVDTGFRTEKYFSDEKTMPIGTQAVFYENRCWWLVEKVKS